MLHPSYTELMKLINKDSGEDSPVINSRYSIVMATAKRARQIIGGDANVTEEEAHKPLSTAVNELKEGLVRIVSEDQGAEDEFEISQIIDQLVKEVVPSNEKAALITEGRAATKGEDQ